MPNALVFIAPLALLLPGSMAVEHGGAQLLPEETSASQPAASADPALGWMIIESLVSTPTQNQVRIEQRVTIRISPLANSPRQSLMPEAPRVSLNDLEERDAGKCVALRSIRGVQSANKNRLLLYMRDRKVMSLRMKKNCRAQDFYSGFYVEPRSDGLLCVERDMLRSRTGANCEVTEINRLVLED